ncbi:UNVERIFIED_CONTAM: hypothetical protein FKN15_032689 [Acipenser sinensis]
MGRKSCKKQQKRQQLQPQQRKRWWSRVPTQFGPPNWAAEQEQWRAEGAPTCDACGEFGHDKEDCPYGDPQYEEAWNQGLVGDAAEWFWAANHTQVSSTPRNEEPKCPPPKLATTEEECLLIPPPSPEEISWEAILSTVEASCWCPICGQRGHTPLNCPLLPEGRLLRPVPPAEVEYLLVPPPSPPPGEGACLLVPPLQPEGEEPLPPSQPEGEEPLPPSQPEGEEPLPPSQPEGEETLPPSPGGPGQDARSPQLPLNRLLRRARRKTVGAPRLRRGPTLAPPLVLAPLLQSPPEGPLPPRGLAIGKCGRFPGGPVCLDLRGPLVYI